jgi:hypothetical protein
MSVERSLSVDTATWTLRFPATLPAGGNDWPRDLAVATDRAIIIDRADLPEIRAEVDGMATWLHPSDEAGDRYVLDMGRLPRWRQQALKFLAMVEYAEAHPPVDEADVEALAALFKGGADDARRRMARDLLATGRVEVKR